MIIIEHKDNYERFRKYFHSPFLMLGNQRTNMDISPATYFNVIDYKTIDLDGGDYQDITDNLPELHNKFETVFNLGTLEHVWDVHTAWSNSLKFVKEGGYFIGESPINGYYRHGIHITDPVAILSFFQKNGFEILDSYISNPNGQVLDDTAFLRRKKNLENANLLFWYAAKKINHLDQLLPPTQIWSNGKNIINSI